MFEFLTELATPLNERKHIYTFAVIGMKRSRHDRIFMSRSSAIKYMHKLANKYNLKLIKMYDDKHFKTYIYTDGVKMFINRV